MVPSPRVPRSAHYPHLTSWITSLKCGAKLGQVGLLSAVAFLGLLAGCTGGGSSPAPPSQPSVTVTSSSTSVLLGATQQFTATVTGTSNTAVSWSVNNVAGGNATVGTIDTNGLYTAPADLPSPANITIKATSQAGNTVSDSKSTTVISDVIVGVTTNPVMALAVSTSSQVQVIASIASQGKPDQNITWSVNGIANGNSAIGIISSMGQNSASYQAPATVPTPFTVSISATSRADASKSASVPMVVAGTIASTSQSISAATGGTITLPDGSSVAIAPGVLSSDQLLTLSEVSYLPVQPPNVAISGVGPGLILTFANPVQFSAAEVAGAHQTELSRTAESINITTAVAPPSAFQFSVNTTNNNVPLLNGSAPSVNLIDAVGISTFTGVAGNYDSTAKVVTGSVGFDLLHGFVNDKILKIQFSAMNMNASIFGGHFTFVPGPLSLGLDNQGNPAWGPYLSCPTGRTLVLVHGMFSTVQGGDKEVGATYPAQTAQAIQKAGNYGSVVGFDYDWLQSINASGAQLGNFLDILAGCAGITQLDIEAHSEGVPVSMSAIVQNGNGKSPTTVNHLISLGGPVMGTPAANDVRKLQGLILMSPTVSLTDKVIDLVTILASPFVTDLRMSTQKDGSTLDTIRTSISPRLQQKLPQMIVGGGAASQILGKPFTLVCDANCDGAIPLTSALAFDSGLEVYPLIPFSSLGHNDLVSNAGVEQLIGQQVTERLTPTFFCGGTLNCKVSRISSIQFTGTNFDPAVKKISIHSQDSSGAVVPLPLTGLQDVGGSLSWLMPICSETAGVHSIFVFDSFLVSNNVAQIVDPSTCSAGPAGNIVTVVGNGIAGYSGDNGPASSAHLFVPSGIAFDPSGNMFVADSSNNVIRRIDAISQVITTVAGIGVPGYSGDKGPAVNAQLNDPTHVVFDRSGNLYITDALNERIRKVDTTTGIITTVAGNGIAGFSGDGGPATNAELNFPDGVSLDGSENVYIGDALNNRIRKLDVTTGILMTVAGTGVTGFSGDGGLATNAELNFPSRPALDAAGNIYISDFQNNRVRRVDATTHVIVTVAGTGTAGYSGDGGQARNADLNGPISVTVDTSGNLYIGDINNERIRLINTGTNPITVAGFTIPPGIIVTIAGNGIVGYQGDGGPATGAELNFPTGLLLNPGGNLYFADAKNNVIRVVSLQ